MPPCRYRLVIDAKPQLQYLEESPRGYSLFGSCCAFNEGPFEAAADGSIFVIHRCAANSCAGRLEPPIRKLDANGKLLKAFGNGMFIFPHGSGLDREGNLWVPDVVAATASAIRQCKSSPDSIELM
jgi:hypothetical protein